MENPFYTSSRVVSRSMNQVYLATLPDQVVSISHQGRRSFSLLSLNSLLESIRNYASALGIEADETDLVAALNARIHHENDQIRMVARQIAVRYGHSLAIVLLTLKQGKPENRAARHDWSEAHWGYWANIDTVWLGGGLAAGNMGDIVTRAAQSLIHELGYSDYRIQLAPQGANLALVGTQKLLTQHEKPSLLFDFGHTTIKRGICVHGEMVYLPTVSAYCPGGKYRAGTPSEAEEQLGYMLQVIRQTWEETKRDGYALSDEMAVSLACYLYEGHPAPQDLGCYGQLQLLAPHLKTFLVSQFSQTLEQEINLHLIHDGTAAALVYDGSPNTAVLTLGTAVGIGFPSSN